jgi:hypothetical protein
VNASLSPGNAGALRAALARLTSGLLVQAGPRWPHWPKLGQLRAELVHALEPLAHRQRAVAGATSSGCFQLRGDVFRFTRGILGPRS